MVKGNHDRSSKADLVMSGEDLEPAKSHYEGHRFDEPLLRENESPVFRAQYVDEPLETN